MPELYYLQKNVLTLEECEHLTTYISDNSEADQREGYRHSGFYIQDFYKGGTRKIDLLRRAAVICNSVFTENYDFKYNTFELKRFFGNTMYTGAINEPHDDDGDDYPGKPDIEEHYSAILMLNSEYTGGELFFPHHNKEVRLEAGDLIMFRGNAENLHGVRKVLSGSRVNVIIFFRNYPKDSPSDNSEWLDFINS
jgi:hypothetical protein